LKNRRAFHYDISVAQLVVEPKLRLFWHSTENLTLVGALACGATASANLVRGDAYFWANALCFFLPQLVALGAARLCGCANRSSLAGFGVGLAVYLIGVSHLPVQHAKAGVTILLLYLLGLPGGIAALLATFTRVQERMGNHVVPVVITTSALSLLGMAASSGALFALMILGTRH
jgi:hypothetical protein